MGNMFIDTVQLWHSTVSILDITHKNPIKDIIPTYKVFKALNKIEDRFKHVIFDNVITINLLYDFILFIKDTNSNTEYSSKQNAFGVLNEVSLLVKNNNTNESDFMISLYFNDPTTKTDEIHFSIIEKDKGKIMVYPKYLFVYGYVSRKTAIAEYDEDFINMVKQFMYDSTINVAKKGEQTNGKRKYLHRIIERLIHRTSTSKSS